ncbi:hypothetical protein [Gracilibacillus thailandensis]|uniref:Uncharacterized protein n=1 Tax=Gracilibacillus thailandensis TaxID=563735 RepID=A0A6N7QVK9_9BACI|nr:hypothetical protein [Gracilibacillus thailandensis]MRI66143.1 hypothetical protein [Gracilibacillus thailandensis]
MAVKDVYSIRITKDDDDIRKYLEQFPEKKQNKALKSLLKYGADRLQEDYIYNQAIHELNQSVKKFQDKQEEKLEEIKDLLSNIKSSDVSNISKDKEDDNASLNVDKARKSMQEALSMFTG